MPGAWNVTTGSPDVVVAVLDTGVDFSHPDLKGRLLPGVDWYYRDRDPADDDGHGTFVSGIVAANRNTMGVAGIDWNCKIMPVKVGGPNGFPVSMVAYGIYSAIDSGADIINMSFGGYVDSGIKSEAIWEAYREGIITVAACGNDSSLEPMYPASYLPVISVGASNQSDERAYFSNYGYYMDLLAPGTDIYSTSLGGERADFELSPGTYYLWIYDCYNHWSEDPYSISVDISPWQPAPEGELVMEVEPNDTCYYAGSMNFSDFGAGYFDNIYFCAFFVNLTNS